MLEIEQKKAGVRHTFCFHDTHVNLKSIEKDGSTGDIDVDYSNIPRKTTILVERNEFLRWLGYLWMFLGLFEVASAIFMYLQFEEQPHVSGLFWLGVIFLLIYKFRQIKYTVFKTPQGGLLVIDDKHHDSVVVELGSRRKARLLDLYSPIDFENDPELEKDKFTWLVEEEVMSLDDADLCIDKIDRYQLNRDARSEDEIN